MTDIVRGRWHIATYGQLMSKFSLWLPNPQYLPPLYPSLASGFTVNRLQRLLLKVKYELCIWDGGLDIRDTATVQEYVSMSTCLVVRVFEYMCSDWLGNMSVCDFSRVFQEAWGGQAWVSNGFCVQVMASDTKHNSIHTVKKNGGGTRWKNKNEKCQKSSQKKKKRLRSAVL